MIPFKEKIRTLSDKDPQHIGKRSFFVADAAAAGSGGEGALIAEDIDKGSEYRRPGRRRRLKGYIPAADRNPLGQL